MNRWVFRCLQSKRAIEKAQRGDFVGKILLGAADLGEYKRIYVGGFGIGNINTDGIENGLEIHSVEDVNGARP